MKTFGEISRKEQLDLFEAWLDGKTIEAQYVDKFSSNATPQWATLKIPSWGKEGVYRIRVTKPSINWDHVHPMYKYMATDKSGHTFLYTHKVTLAVEGNAYFPEEGNSCKTDHFSSFQAGTCNWTDSLVERPGVEYDE